MQKSLFLFLPGLLPSSELPSLETQQAIQLDALSTILSRATCQREGPISVDSAIRLFFSGLDKTMIPAGALSALHYGFISRDDKNWWCRADPVECLVDQQSAVLMGNQHFQFTKEELSALSCNLNRLLEQDGMTLNAISSNEWFCKVMQNTDVVMNDFTEVLNKNLLPLLPSGPDQAYWRRLLTETQMLLSNTLLPTQAHSIVSLWFWGLGRLPQTIETQFDSIYANDSVICGLAKCTKKPNADLPSRIQTLLNAENGQNVLVADLSLYTLMRSQQFDAWADLLHQYETTWFQPLLQALLNKDLHTLTIGTADGRKFFLSKKHLHYFWRRKKRFHEFALS